MVRIWIRGGAVALVAILLVITGTRSIAGAGWQRPYEVYKYPGEWWDIGRLQYAQEPTRHPDYTGVNPNQNIVVNGRVVSVSYVYRGMHGPGGLEYKELGEVLDLDIITPDYRKTNLSEWDYGAVPEQWINTMKQTTCYGWLGIAYPCLAPEQEKVWFYDETFRQSVIFTYKQTYANGNVVGSGFYRYTGKKVVRMDEVVPFFGGFVMEHENGLVEIYMPPRNETATDAQGCVVNEMLDDEGNCNLKAAILPSAYGTYGDEKILSLLGWQADSGNSSAATTIRGHVNVNALKLEGKSPTWKDKLQEINDSAVFWVPFTLMVMEFHALGVSFLEYYFPNLAFSTPAVSSTPRTAEWADEALERESAFVHGVQMSETEVAALSRQKYGIDSVVGEFQGATQRGWYWKIRSMTPAAARAQAIADGEILEIAPGKYIAKEFYTGGTNGVWMDGYDEVATLLRENKGFYQFMVKNGEIDPAFIKNGKFLKVVEQLDRQVLAAQAAGDRLQWIFTEAQFPLAFQRWMQVNRPDLYRLMGTGTGQVFTFVIY